MAILKCKMCSGTLDISDDSGIAVCQYCGTKQTIPHLDDEKRIQMFDRANHFRRNHEYDKAMGIFEQILAEDSADAEAFWSIVLCRFGIDYVEDPKTHRRVPTINRIQSRSIFADDDYKQALNNANLAQKTVYEQEAEEINRIQKEYLKISNEEDPFDIFICYKETDDTGKRTQDSVIANDLYYQLVNEGYKVFFSKITLEGKLGSAYEPYIFSALNSARIMIVLGTKPEYFKAVWVKNEWARFLAMMKDGANKTLIPAYRDMDPYDLPEDFAYLQALDMGKIGFVQDLLRGIDKIFNRIEDHEKTVIHEGTSSGNTGGNASALLKRGELALEDSDWKKAYDYFDQALNIDAESGDAYLGQALSEIRVKSLDSLAEERIKLFELKLGHISLDSVYISDEASFGEVNHLIQDNKILLGNAIEFEEYTIPFKTGIKQMEKLIDEEIMWFDSNKNLSKAIRFSEKIRNDVQEIRELLLKRMKSEMESMKLSEDEKRKEVLLECGKHYDDIRQKVLVRIQQRREEYEELRCQYYSGKLDYMRVSELKEFQMKLKVFFGYQETDRILDEISLRIQEKDGRLHAELNNLKERERQIIFYEFAKIKGRNSYQKEVELRKELIEVQRKIQEIEAEL